MVYEDDAVIAFLDVAPLTEGHLLVVPREHFGKLTEVPPSVAAKLGSVLPSLGRALLEVTKAEGFNVLVNEGRAAGQQVSHLHFHLIPRKSGDLLGYRWNPGSYPPGRAGELAVLLQTAVSRYR